MSSHELMARADRYERALRYIRRLLNLVGNQLAADVDVAELHERLSRIVDAALKDEAAGTEGTARRDEPKEQPE